MLVHKTRGGGTSIYSGYTSSVVQYNNTVYLTVGGLDYKFTGEEYTIRLLDDGKIVEEVSGVILEPTPRQSWIVGIARIGWNLWLTLVNLFCVYLYIRYVFGYPL